MEQCSRLCGLVYDQYNHFCASLRPQHRLFWGLPWACMDQYDTRWYVLVCNDPCWDLWLVLGTLAAPHEVICSDSTVLCDEHDYNWPLLCWIRQGCDNGNALLHLDWGLICSHVPRLCHCASPWKKTKCCTSWHGSLKPDGIAGYLRGWGLPHWGCTSSILLIDCHHRCCST